MLLVESFLQANDWINGWNESSAEDACNKYFNESILLSRILIEQQAKVSDHSTKYFFDKLTLEIFLHIRPFLCKIYSDRRMYKH
jgi:hypothetical protein